MVSRYCRAQLDKIHSVEAPTDPILLASTSRLYDVLVTVCTLIVASPVHGCPTCP